MTSDEAARRPQANALAIGPFSQPFPPGRDVTSATVKRPTRDPDALAYLRLVGLGAAIGIPAALLAAVFLALVHDLEHWLWDDLPSSLGYTSPPWYLVIGLP
jgi:hypothetical protein